MPEYLAPGVYVEEVSFRSKSIEGVPTSTTGFAGLTQWGPVQYPGGPTTTEPRLITSFTEFEYVYGGLERFVVGAEERIPYLAHAARAFFLNGGKRLYVSRVFVPVDVATDLGVASRAVTVGTRTATWRARWPGSFGEVPVEVKPVRSKNIAVTYTDAIRAAWGIQATRAKHGAVVEVIPAGTLAPENDDPLQPATLSVITVDTEGKQTFNGVVPNPGDTIQLIELRVIVHVTPERVDVHDELGAHPDQKRYIARILQRDDPEDENAVVWLDWNHGAPATAPLARAAQLMVALTTNPAPRLDGGNNGQMPLDVDFAGDEANPDVATQKATGLAALGEIDDIAIVALPDSGDLGGELQSRTAAQALIAHAELMRYRIAVVDGPIGSSMTEVRQFRGKFDSKYAALYHPWIEILDPTERAAQGAPPRRLLLPPSGFVTGIYARNDIERGVFKAPANEIVRGLSRFEANINKARNDVLNPEGINPLRFFEGRGSRVWGARTMSSDPEWKYVNVRRFFIFLEHSIDKASQWAVFEPNNERLWANIRHTIEDFLLVQWRDGALLGSKPEEAYFVRCDRTTMTQNDLDNGRMICLIGVAPTKPAEFVIFRIGQWTADSKV
jgi:phage tail sheath protein FI